MNLDRNQSHESPHLSTVLRVEELKLASKAVGEIEPRQIEDDGHK